jgi:adenylate cyclase
VLATEVPMEFMAAFGLVVGLLTTVAVTRSVADPLRVVRLGLRRVGEGDLDSELPVDDAGEIGRLQSGFNRMVAGLRERRRLADLFGRHVGTEVARRAVEQGVQLGGELREVSVLFVDVIGSTTLAATHEPHDVVAILNEFFGAVVSTTNAEDGWVNKFEGDAALCVFGAPTDQPDHATRALRAARALRAKLDGLVGVPGGLDAGVGVSTGKAVAGNVGAEDRYEYTVIGDPVNEAARLTELAKSIPGRVAVSSTAVERADEDERGHWTVGERHVLRGRTHETQTFLLAPRDQHLHSKPDQPLRSP